MRCPCTTRLLQLFVHSITRIDLDATLHHSVCSRGFSGSLRQIHIGPRPPRTERGHNDQYATGSPLRHSIEDAQSSAHIYPSTEQVSGSGRRWRSRLITNLDHGPNKPQIPASSTDTSEQRSWGTSRTEANLNSGSAEEIEGSAILEITPSIIDALAAESVRDTDAPRGREYEPKYSPTRSTPLSATSTRVPGRASRPVLDPGDTELQKRGRRLATASEHVRREPTAGKGAREPWQVQKTALKEKFPEGWNARKRLSPDALAGIRAIHAQFPEHYTLRVLADKFEVSPEAIRRILKSKWTPKDEEEIDRRRRWFSRGTKVWSRYGELGMKPPARWRKAFVVNKDGLHASGEALNSTTAFRDSTHITSDKASRIDALSDRIL